MSWDEIDQEMDKMQKIVAELKEEGATRVPGDEESIENKKKLVESHPKEKEKTGQTSTEEEKAVEKLILDKYQQEAIDTDDREKKLLEEGYGGARRKQRSSHRQKQWRESSLTRTPPIKSTYVNPGAKMLATEEPCTVIRGPNVIGSPPSYKRFDSPKPPPVVKVN